VLRSGVAKIYRLAVCKGPNCTFNGANDVFKAAVQAVAEQGLQGRCLVARGGCYGMCAFGPNVIVRVHDPAEPPDPLSSRDFMLLGVEGEQHYSGMAPGQMTRLVAEQVGEDHPVAEWLHANRPRRF
jgi:(2Fe-2S) ferredoxin